MCARGRYEGLELTALETKVISHTGLPRVRFSQGRSEKPTVLRCMFAWKVLLQLNISTIWGRLGQRVRARWDAAATEAWGRGGAGAANQGLGIQVGTGRCVYRSSIRHARTHSVGKSQSCMYQRRVQRQGQAPTRSSPGSAQGCSCRGTDLLLYSSATTIF